MKIDFILRTFNLVHSTPQHVVLNALTAAQVEQLHALYQNEWWSVGRSLEDVRVMLQHVDFIFAIAEPGTGRLIAFARVLTDRVFKALIFDVIVHPDHRSAGLGSFLINHILKHPVISGVRHVELYCLPDRVNLYQRHGFTQDLGKLVFMRRANPLT